MNGDAPTAITSASDGAEGPIPPKTAKQKLARKNELKAKSTLLLAIPDEHLLKFHGIKDEKSLWEAIKTRFGGNKESKKMQKIILKQQYEIFAASRSEGLDKTYDRSLPSAWNNIALIMHNKADLDKLSMDDLYNNLKVYEAEIKIQSSLSSNSQNVAFVSSDDTSSTNEAVNTAHDVPATRSKGQASSSTYADDVMFSFFVNQSNSPQLDNEDLKQIDTDDLEEMDLKWAPRNQVNRNRDAPRRIVPVETSANALVVQDGIGGYDWSYQAEEGPTDLICPFLSSPFIKFNSKLCDPTILAITLTVERSILIGKLQVLSELDYPQRALKKKGIVDSECSRHMTRNKAHLAEYQDYNGGPVAFRGSKGYITGIDIGLLYFTIKRSSIWYELERLSKTRRRHMMHLKLLEEEFAQNNRNMLLQADYKAKHTNTINIASTPVSTASPSGGLCFTNLTNTDQDDSEIPNLEDSYDHPNDGIFTNSSYDDEGAVADFTNLETIVNVSPIPTLRINSIHPSNQILGDPKSAVQTRSKVNKSTGAHAFVSYIQKQRRNNHKDFQHCLFACFLSQIEPKKISEALKDKSWVDAINKNDERGVVVRNKARIEAIRIFWPLLLILILSLSAGFELRPFLMQNDEEIHDLLFKCTWTALGYIMYASMLVLVQGVSTEDQVSTIKPNEGTDKPKVITDNIDEGTAELKNGNSDENATPKLLQYFLEMMKPICLVSELKLIITKLPRLQEEEKKKFTIKEKPNYFMIQMRAQRISAQQNS
ncbi:hypothetical protein Tco_0662710 [Tanacetum coccineum]